MQHQGICEHNQILPRSTVLLDQTDLFHLNLDLCYSSLFALLISLLYVVLESIEYSFSVDFGCCRCHIVLWCPLLITHNDAYHDLHA